MVFGLGDKKEEAQAEPPSEFKVRMGNAAGRGARWMLYAAIGAVVLGALVAFMTLGNPLMLGGAVLAGATGTVTMAGILKVGLAIVGGAGLLGGIMGYTDDQKYQAAMDDYEREGQKGQLKAMEKQRMSLALRKQAMESDRQAQAMGLSGEGGGQFMPPNVPFGSSGGGGRGMF